jgi:lantibiotic modifying enzyme
VVWGLVWLSRLADEPRLLAAAGDLTGRLEAPRGREFDLDRGAAGAILGLLALAGATGAAAPLAAARRWGDALLAGQTVTGSAAAAWRNRASLAQTGFAHGAAGIARALAALATAGGGTRYLVAAAAAIGHERRLFDPARRNWPVLLAGGGKRGGRRWMVAWCRGAAGIALSRLYLPACLHDAALEAEREIALETTATAPPCSFDHLCCGNLGRSSVLLSAADRTGEGRWRTAAEGIADAFLERAAAGELTFGSENDGPAAGPGFLRGCAGAGYQLLRLAHPELPDVLALELPGERRSAEAG